MKRNILIRTVALTVIIASFCSFVACKKEKPAESSDTSEEETTTTATTTTEPTTSLTEYSGPLPSNDTEITWTETMYDEPVVRYVATNDYMNIRRGPGTEYDAVGRLFRGQTVTIIGYTANNWCVTADHFYVSGDYLSESAV